ncbi:MAG TPA: pyruvate kinase [Bacillota bacterium]
MSIVKRTKIVCTLGPSSSTLPVIKDLIKAGMNVARINMSHGTWAEHQERIELVRAAARELQTVVGILIDIQGPKIRTGVLPGKMLLEDNTLVCLASEHKPLPSIGNEYPLITTDYEYLMEDSRIGNNIYLHDGLIKLRVEKVGENFLLCRVLEGGELDSKKGLSLPGVSVRLPALTEKDLQDLKFAAEIGADFIALSFTRRASHIEEVRRALQSYGRKMQIIAKIENQEGYDNREAILSAADGLMVARGDLGTELPLEDVPIIQRTLIRAANRHGKPVITATEMLESMIRNSRPTRAEATDVAHAILDGTDAVMLSGETAVGRYPVQAVEVMSRVARRIEATLEYEGPNSQEKRRNCARGKSLTIGDAVSHGTCQIAADLKAQAIITATQSGSTARMVSKYRPNTAILATTPNPEVARALSLIWGVTPMVVPGAKTTDETLDQSIQAALASGLVKKGDLVVVTAGVRTGIPGTTNLLQVQEV